MKRVWALIALFVFALTGATLAQLQNENFSRCRCRKASRSASRTRKTTCRSARWSRSNETVNDWTEMVTVQIFLRPQDDARAVQDQHREGAGAGLPGASGALPVDRSRERLSGPGLGCCPAAATKHRQARDHLVQGVQGNDSFYVVQKAFRFMPAQEQMTKALAYLGTVTVCDSRRKDRACPRMGD